MSTSQLVIERLEAKQADTLAVERKLHEQQIKDHKRLETLVVRLAEEANARRLMFDRLEDLTELEEIVRQNSSNITTLSVEGDKRLKALEARPDYSGLLTLIEAQGVAIRLLSEKMEVSETKVQRTFRRAGWLHE